MSTSIDELITKVREFVYTDKRVDLLNSDYLAFKDNITDFVFGNHVDEGEEWKTIKANMVWKTSQHMISSEANIIIV